MALHNHKQPDWDIIIVGAGPAGCAAAMVLARSRRKVMLMDDGNPRNKKSQGIHNYLTRDGILPADFVSATHAELGRYSINHVKSRAVSAAKAERSGFMVTDVSGQKYHCRKLLVATGVTDIIPDIPGMLDMWGNGVYHCPFCDGWDLKEQTVGLYAKRFNGYGMALALKQLSGNVILFTDTATYLKPIQRAHLQSQGIKIYNNKVAHLSCDRGKLTCVTLANGESIACSSVFTHNGIRYNNELVLQLGVRCNKNGATVINKRQECSVPGVYVAGDAAFDMQFVSVAAAEGVKAAVAIHNALMQEDNLTSLTSLQFQ